ncbi:hypothetical protein VTN00DRAFT_2376 [Thermoascus crustaceus]|uniref:uncharacterized protein n=1 Tax=Thermoascus crustaceus TaxID=5088 RepID=UPI00374405F7
MSETANLDALSAPQQGAFHPSIKPTGPMMDKGHQLGTKIAPSDFVPEFQAKTAPPGTAPEKDTYTPNPIYSIPGQANNPDVLRGHGKQSTHVSASSTLQGATSRDVHRGLGHPGVGQTSNELRHSGEHKRKHRGLGLEGVGASGHPQEPNERILADQRGVEREGARGGQHGNKGESGAEDIPPTQTERLSAEWHDDASKKKNVGQQDRNRSGEA